MFFVLSLFTANAQIGEVQIDIGLRLGYFMPADSGIKDFYGNGLMVGGDLIFWTESGFGGGISVDYYYKGKKITYYGGYSSQIDYDVLPILFTGYYRIKSDMSPLVPYFGAGFGLHIVGEDVSGDYLENVSLSDTALGFHVIGGIQFMITESTSMFGEVKYTYAKAELSKGNDFNCGGFSICAGIRF